MINPIPEVHSHTYGESATQPPPSTQPPPLTQGYPSSQLTSFEWVEQGTQPPPPAHRSSPATATPTPRRPARTGRAVRRTQRSARVYDPVRSQRTSHLREGGRGRTRGTPNYKPREVEILLDLAEGELPIGPKGWKVVGCQFRDWAAVAEYPARTDRSLELKYKQVRVTPVGGAWPLVAHNPLVAREDKETNWRCRVSARDLSCPRDRVQDPV